MTLKPNKDYFIDIWKEFKPLFKEAVELEMQLGTNIIIEDARDKGKKTKDSGLTLSEKDINNFMKKLELNVKGVNEDISKKITNTILENISNRGSNIDLAAEIKQIFNTDSPDNFNYKNRYETVAKTESANILNISGHNKALDLGAKKKYLSGVNDNRQGGDSKVALDKYGSEEQAIPVKDNFKFTFNNKPFDYLLPPNRPNDRELALYVYE